MKPSRYRRIKRLLSRRWFIKVRIWKYGRLYERCNKKLFTAGPYELDQLSEDMNRYAIKEAWYIKKLNNK